MAAPCAQKMPQITVTETNISNRLVEKHDALVMTPKAVVTAGDVACAMSA